MIAASHRQTLSAFSNRYAAAGLALLTLTAALVLVLGRLDVDPALLQGWLLAFAIWSCVPVGSMNLLLIHRLTGGTWAIAAAPVLRPLAAMMPLVAIAFVPVLATLPSIYPWAANPGEIKPDVAVWYLSQASFILRAVVTLAGWSVLAVIFASGLGGRLLAGLGLAFFGLTISMVAVDWFLSVEPHYVSTDFASMIAIQQLLAALAVLGVVGIANVAGRARSDIGKLLMATLLGVVYLTYMTFVVAWYGDLPHKAAWFLKRGTDTWAAVLVATLVIGAVLPFTMLLLAGVRASRAGLRAVGGLLLLGTGLHFAWLILPAFERQAAAALAGLGSLVILTASSALFGRGLAFGGGRHAG
ncbi:hypothetical protein QY049_24325 [Bradyrhizobium sp. WYCCWR 13022]|uniref:hypothetical protein n=1 Tax=unclassified Bradyrhizobium TaxID=2631580 RepID=UPI00263ACD61|nr:hypothetical protein [Bradyrhizobium sp. WYCCWR 13022]MDN4986286.1 hypothetical protein [Bradyrhizobium sp. WYCCWR 13022]